MEVISESAHSSDITLRSLGLSHLWNSIPQCNYSISWTPPSLFTFYTLLMTHSWVLRFPFEEDKPFHFVWDAKQSQSVNAWAANFWSPVQVTSKSHQYLCHLHGEECRIDRKSALKKHLGSIYLQVRVYKKHIGSIHCKFCHNAP
jgi:hypothetical protein